jgi:methylmalonyl-CoA mutase
VNDEGLQAPNNVRVVTATSLFDGHDAAINIFRRILQSTGVEVIHLGHNRSVKEIVDAAIQEDAQGIAISSYQGGHVEFFKYMVDLLKQGGAGHIKVFGGGGGVIVPEEIKELEAYGVTKIYSPEDGAQHGAAGDHQPHGRNHGLLPGADETLPGSVRPDHLNKLRVANLITVEQAKAQENGTWSNSARLQRENRQKKKCR